MPDSVQEILDAIRAKSQANRNKLEDLLARFRTQEEDIEAGSVQDIENGITRLKRAIESMPEGRKRVMMGIHLANLRAEFEQAPGPHGWVVAPNLWGSFQERQAQWETGACS